MDRVSAKDLNWLLSNKTCTNICEGLISSREYCYPSPVVLTHELQSCSIQETVPWYCSVQVLVPCTNELVTASPICYLHNVMQ